MERVVPIFIHITKTAGGTLKEAVRSAPGLSPHFIYSQDARSCFDPKVSHLVFGHFGFGIHEELGLAPCYITFLRHPFTRTVSHYYHLVKVDRSRVGDMIRHYDDINHFFAEQRYWEFNNLMCRFISGDVKNVSCSDETYDRAVNNIENYFLYIGIQEYFDISIFQLSHLLETKLRVKKRINVGSYSFAEMNRATIKRIIELNQQDIKLYKLCIGRFIARFGRLEKFLSLPPEGYQDEA